MGTAPHIKGRFSSRLNRFSCEHALAAGKTPVWLNIAAHACRQAVGNLTVVYAKRRRQRLFIDSEMGGGRLMGMVIAKVMLSSGLMRVI
ncbi:hypothetical protein [Pseudomonas hunanensis]|uniref:hypothetical protein n=1 Tax=Pseudomonas hunanensis TaxID=1247546 RepID=UPI0030D83BAE